MKCIPVQDAVGLTLCHDITEIVPGGRKGPAFIRGHIVQDRDIPHLLRLGKEHLYVWEHNPGLVHEDDAAQRIVVAAAGSGLIFSTPKEGRINLLAEHDGLLQIDIDLLDRINSIPYVTFATIHSMQAVKKGRAVAGTRVIPLMVPEGTVQAVEECCLGKDLIQVIPFQEHQVGIITTGSEVYHGRVKDAFGPVLYDKFAGWGSSILSQVIVPDETEITVKAIEETIENGASFIVVTGGMSVDPDDKTPAAIRAVGCDVICYGAPAFPGAMFMVGYKGHIPVLGLPGCVMYHRASIFDLVVPKILAGFRITHQDIIQLAHGGFCENCPECHFPVCGFGK